MNNDTIQIKSEELAALSRRIDLHDAEDKAAFRALAGALESVNRKLDQNSAAIKATGDKLDENSLATNATREDVAIVKTILQIGKALGLVAGGARWILVWVGPFALTIMAAWAFVRWRLGLGPFPYP